VRFLVPIAGALGVEATFTGEGRLAERPLQPLLEVLAAQGCHFSSEHLPLTVTGQLAGGIYELPGDVSSQYLTGLLFALPLFEKESLLRLTSPLESAGYVEMTLAVLRSYGITVERLEESPEAAHGGWRIAGGQRYVSPPDGMPEPEPDWSSAAFWLVANALGSTVDVGALPTYSAQPDRIVTDLLARLQTGANEGQLAALEMDASGCPDLVPVMAVAMAVAEGTSRITNALRLRLKESDRLAAIASNLVALGARVSECADGLEIIGVERLRGGAVSSYGDHRIAMAMGIAATVCTEPLTLENPDDVSKSYPGFWEEYQRAGGTIRSVLG
jgi:3-phosphoshikimate 1-carboxyvinyltransferase